MLFQVSCRTAMLTEQERQRAFATLCFTINSASHQNQWKKEPLFRNCLITSPPNPFFMSSSLDRSTNSSQPPLLTFSKAKLITSWYFLPFLLLQCKVEACKLEACRECYLQGHHVRHLKFNISRDFNSTWSL